MSRYNASGLEADAVKKTIFSLEDRLVGCIDLQLVLKHIHWNVVGPNFIAVHEMLDEHVVAVRKMSDEIAERISTLGGEPRGTPGHLVAARDWEDYSLGRAPVRQHLDALDRVYSGMIADHRKAIAATAETDPISEDLLIGQTAQLELFQWFVRAHLDNAG